MKKSLLACILAIFALGTANAKTYTYKVDCGKRGASIQKTLDIALKKFPVDTIVVNVSGTCNENVFIPRGTVFLTGSASGGTTIRGVLDGSDPVGPVVQASFADVTLENLTIERGSSGIAAFSGSVIAVNCSIAGSETGVFAADAFVQLIDTTVGGDADVATDDYGIDLEQGAELDTYNTQVSGFNTGLYANSGSAAFLDDGTVVSNNFNAATIVASSIVLLDATVEIPTPPQGFDFFPGIAVWNNSGLEAGYGSVQITGADALWVSTDSFLYSYAGFAVDGDVYVDSSSHVYLDQSAVSGDFYTSFDSNVTLYGGAQVNGTIECIALSFALCDDLSSASTIGCGTGCEPLRASLSAQAGDKPLLARPRPWLKTVSARRHGSFAGDRISAPGSVSAAPATPETPARRKTAAKR